ncbi:MAG: flagellar motor protein MotB [Planctomycetaceae bacterium]
MAKKDCCGGSSGEIPAWFMTYSDVITLLMTFFILLLTFASSEPEEFAQFQVVAFGGGGGSGAIGEKDELLDKDAVVLRDRPANARRTTRGAETPPLQTDPAQVSLARGLKSLQETDDLADAERVRMETSLAILRDAGGNPTAQAIQQMRMLSIQMKHLPLNLQFCVGDRNDADFCVDLALSMIENYGVDPGRISVSVAGEDKTRAGKLEMLISREEDAF